MISHFSYSSIGMALRCAEQFRRRYILGQIVPPAVAMGMGRGLHKASEVNLSQKIVTRRDMRRDDLLDVAHDEYINTFKEGVFLAPEEEGQKDELLGEGLDKTVKVTGLYADVAAPMIKPVMVEQKFRVQLPGAETPILGFIDCVEEDGLITDLKSTSRSWAKDKITKDMQPVFYTMAYKQMFPKAGQPSFRFLVHVALKKAPKLQELTWTVQKQQEIALMNRIAAVVKMINAGVFVPTDPTNWVCSPRWCGYYQTCKYVGNGNPSTWV